MQHGTVVLQAGVSRSGGSFGVNSALLELDNEADDRCAALCQKLTKKLLTNVLHFTSPVPCRPGFQLRLSKGHPEHTTDPDLFFAKPSIHMLKRCAAQEAM